VRGGASGSGSGWGTCGVGRGRRVSGSASGTGGGGRGKSGGAARLCVSSSLLNRQGLAGRLSLAPRRLPGLQGVLAPQIGSNGLPLAAQMRDNPPPSTRGGRTAGLLGVNSFHCPADKARSSTGGTPPGYGHAACPVTTCGARKRCSPCSPFSGTFSTRAEADVGG